MKLSVFQPKKDLFDRIPDIFDRTELSIEEKVLNSPELQKLIAAEVAKAVAEIKLPEPKEPMPQIVKEVRVEVQKKDDRKLVEQSALDAALKKIENLEKELEETDKRARSPIVVPSGGSGVIGIPPPEAAVDAQVLTVVGKKAKWAAATGGTGGTPISGYTINNGTTLKTIDVSLTSLDEVAQVLGTLITDLQSLFGGGSASSFNIGDSTVDGSWRLIQSGSDLSVQQLVSGIWVEKSVFTP